MHREASAVKAPQITIILSENTQYRVNHWKTADAPWIETNERAEGVNRWSEQFELELELVHLYHFFTET